MIGVVVVTHGQLATELVNAAEMIVGDLPRFAAVSIGWHEDVQDARDEIQAAMGRVKTGTSGVLIITDMFGGTPCNLAMTFLAEHKVEVITGAKAKGYAKVGSGAEVEIEVGGQSKKIPADKILVAIGFRPGGFSSSRDTSMSP